MKRVLDVICSATGLMALSPLLLLAACAVWLEDRQSCLFLAKRVARGGGDFQMVKFRTMVVDAWKSGVNSTSAVDRRITRAGHWLRRTKLDELPQLWNVLLGDMSLVGPRPQVRADASLYTGEERRMLTLRPGITDLASIVFADEGEILASAGDPDLRYNQVIRPWKSRLAILYVERCSMLVDLRIIGWTLISAFDRPRALKGVETILTAWNADPALICVARREGLPPAGPPPGASEVVKAYRVA